VTAMGKKGVTSVVGSSAARGSDPYSLLGQRKQGQLRRRTRADARGRRREKRAGESHGLRWRLGAAGRRRERGNFWNGVEKKRRDRERAVETTGTGGQTAEVAAVYPEELDDGPQEGVGWISFLSPPSGIFICTFFLLDFLV
jgi:hypothetical protein